MGPTEQAAVAARDDVKAGGAIMADVGTVKLKRGLAQMLKGGVIMDVTTAEQARVAEEAGA